VQHLGADQREIEIACARASNGASSTYRTPVMTLPRNTAACASGTVSRVILQKRSNSPRSLKKARRRTHVNLSSLGVVVINPLLGNRRASVF
jgi:hypothetical protein